MTFRRNIIASGGYVQSPLEEAQNKISELEVEIAGLRTQLNDLEAEYRRVYQQMLSERFPAEVTRVV